MVGRRGHNPKLQLDVTEDSPQAGEKAEGDADWGLPTSANLDVNCASQVQRSAGPLTGWLSFQRPQATG